MGFYFTGTGNCLYAARELAAAEGAAAEVASIPQEMRREGALSYAADAIGIVYPIYGHIMPKMVRDFLHRATFETPYFYLVATYGCRHANAVELGQAEARAAGVEPSYISTLLMVDNWLPNFDMDEQRELIPLKRIDENLVRICADVSGRRRRIEAVSDEDRADHEQFLSRGLSFEPEHLDGFLVLDAERCVGCGLCSRVCPAGCIDIESGSAWRRATVGLGCNACLACIHACPYGAIRLPMGEVNPSARWRNEHVSLRDLVSSNS